MQTDPLALSAAGINFKNPILLAAGTAAYGRDVSGVVDFGVLGGIVTKAVSKEPRHGAESPRVAEFEGGMINAVGLANPGMEAAANEELPWLRKNASGARVIVNVVGSCVEDFADVVSRMEDAPCDAYELNVSCPNVKRGGAEFGADANILAALVSGVRSATKRPIFVKLSPMLGDIASTAKVAVNAGADGITVINTIPGLLIDTAKRVPALGFGSGGVSGRGLLPVGVLATWKVSRAVSVPIIGVGGIARVDDVLQYIIAGATLTAIGTAALKDPRVPSRIANHLDAWCEKNNVAHLSEIRGTLQWK